MKWLIASVIFLVVLLAVLYGMRVAKTGGVIIREVVPVQTGECVKVHLDVYHTAYIYGWRIPVTIRSDREVNGVTLHDYESGKFLGRFHDLDAEICRHCNGTGEVKK